MHRKTTQAAIDAVPPDAPRRALFTALWLWRVCPSALCRRQKACRGDTNRCLEERWHPLVPPELKALVQKTLANEAAGMTLQEAAAAAQASLAANRLQAEAFDAPAARPFVPMRTQTRALPDGGNEPPAGPNPRPPRHRGPRMRTL